MLQIIRLVEPVKDIDFFFSFLCVIFLLVVDECVLRHILTLCAREIEDGFIREYLKFRVKSKFHVQVLVYISLFF